MTDRFSFIPNLRLGASADAEMAEDGRLTATYDVAILGNGDEQGSRIGVDARFRGPGDVIGIVPTQIARVEPPDGTGDFEVDYFPFVELTEADLPWRYSLSPNDSDRAAPWFVLIALSWLERGR